MKGIMSIIEVMITGMILFVAFLHFFPQYTIKSKWTNTLLIVKVRDTINTIDRMNKTYVFAKDSVAFKNFINRTFLPENSGSIIVSWKNIDNETFITEEGLSPNEPTPYFTEGYKESIVDVVNTSTGYHVYSFTLGLGYPY